MKALEINGYLLEYYTNLTQHHRTKISLLGGIYLSVSQILLLTSIDTIKTSVATDEIVLIGGIGALITLLFVGILHHIGSLSIIATQRLNVLRTLYFELLPENNDEEDHEYVVWSKEFNTSTRDSFSLSKCSAILASIILVPIFMLTLIRFYSVSVAIVTENKIFLILGAFYFLQIIITVLYGYIIVQRTIGFYKSRKAFKQIQASVSKDECNEFINYKNNKESNKAFKSPAAGTAKNAAL